MGAFQAAGILFTVLTGNGIILVVFVVIAGILAVVGYFIRKKIVLTADVISTAAIIAKVLTLPPQCCALLQCAVSLMCTVSLKT
jgi:hypothetical protein